jgi:AcrR family transcriptional regulator
MDARGRPKSSSRAALEDAATELFLEKGYHNTTVDEIAARAGVSRATFFNYFPAKSAVLWVDVDTALGELEHRVIAGQSLTAALRELAQEFSERSVPLIATQADVMNTGDELIAEAGSRIIGLSRLVALAGIPAGQVWQVTGAIIQAVVEWAHAGVSRDEPLHYLAKQAVLGLD